MNFAVASDSAGVQTLRLRTYPLKRESDRKPGV